MMSDTMSRKEVEAHEEAAMHWISRTVASLQYATMEGYVKVRKADHLEILKALYRLALAGQKGISSRSPHDERILDVAWHQDIIYSNQDQLRLLGETAEARLDAEEQVVTHILAILRGLVEALPEGGLRTLATKYLDDARVLHDVALQVDEDEIMASIDERGGFGADGMPL